MSHQNPVWPPSPPPQDPVSFDLTPILKTIFFMKFSPLILGVMHIMSSKCCHLWWFFENISPASKVALAHRLQCRNTCNATLHAMPHCLQCCIIYNATAAKPKIATSGLQNGWQGLQSSFKKWVFVQYLHTSKHWTYKSKIYSFIHSVSQFIGF